MSYDFYENKDPLKGLDQYLTQTEEEYYGYEEKVKNNQNLVDFNKKENKIKDGFKLNKDGLYEDDQGRILF